MTHALQIEIRDSLADVSAGEWNALDPDANPFLRHEFLHGLEVSGCLGRATGWYPRHVLLRRVPAGSPATPETLGGRADDPRDEDEPHADPATAKAPSDGADDFLPGELIGAVPAYVKTNSYGEFVFDWAWADAYQRHGLDYYPKLVAAIPFTPATGRRLLVRPDQPYAETVRLLASAVRQFAMSEDYSGVHFLFLTEAESEILSAEPALTADEEAALIAMSEEATVDDDPTGEDESERDESESGENDAGVNGSERNDRREGERETSDHGENERRSLAGACDHLRRLDCQYHWANGGYGTFDDFLGDCTSKRRKTIRRERRHVAEAGLVLQRRTGDSLSDAEWHDVHDLYRSTYDRKWGNPSLTEAFFRRMGECFGAETLVVLVRDPADEEPERPVACSIMFRGGDALYGRYWGCRREYNSLHFEACYYQGIEHCIEHGIARFEPGAQGEHKITRGFVPTLTRSAHWIAHPRFRDAIGRFLAEEVPHVERRCAGLADLLPFRADIPPL